MNRTLLNARARARSIRAGAMLLAVLAAVTLHLVHASAAAASSGQTAVIQDGEALQDDTSGTIERFRELGATTVRYLVFWKDIAPSPNARTPPKFNATNPASYPKKAWSALDAIVIETRKAGLRLDLDLTGPPPNWAQGPGVSQYAINARYGWRPNAADYGKFVQAVAERYDGRYKADGQTLPKVSTWSLWNEPNFGQDLGPGAEGATPKFTGYLVAPGYYRNLLRTAWPALQRYVKGSTILIGEYAGQGRTGPVTKGPHGHPQGLPGNYAITSPVPFIQTLYCVDAKGHRLTGKVASYAGCPANASQARAFRRNNPALFDASAMSFHPYASGYAPNTKLKVPSNFIILPVIGRATTVLNQVTRAWGVHRSYPIWSTEYGYITSPPKPEGTGYPSVSTAAIYLNEAEYLSYKNPRIQSFAQYLLADPPILAGHGLFASGLLTDKNKPKPTFDAWRLPLWMPNQTVKRGASAEVWGGARPAALAGSMGRTVKVQERIGGGWRTLATEKTKSGGYFDTHLTFTSGGSLRLAYTYPLNEPLLPMGVAGTTVYSRTLAITVR